MTSIDITRIGATALYNKRDSLNQTLSFHTDRIADSTASIASSEIAKTAAIADLAEIERMIAAWEAANPEPAPEPEDEEEGE